MRTGELKRRRLMCVGWGALAIICLAGAGMTWLVSDVAGENAIFGVTGSAVLIAAAIVVTAVAIGAGSWSRQTNAALRWGLALPVAIIAGGVAVEALRGVFAPETPADLALGLLLMTAVVGMNVVAAQVARRVAASRDRL